MSLSTFRTPGLIFRIWMSCVDSAVVVSFIRQPENTVFVVQFDYVQTMCVKIWFMFLSALLRLSLKLFAPIVKCGLKQ